MARKGKPKKKDPSAYFPLTRPGNVPPPKKTDGSQDQAKPEAKTGDSVKDVAKSQTNNTPKTAETLLPPPTIVEENVQAADKAFALVKEPKTPNYKDTKLTVEEEWQSWKDEKDDVVFLKALFGIHRLAKHRVEGIKNHEEKEDQRLTSNPNLIDITLTQQTENQLIAKINPGDELAKTTTIQSSLPLYKSLKAFLTDLDITFEILLGYGIPDSFIRKAFQTVKPKSFVNLIEWICLNVPTSDLPNNFWCNRDEEQKEKLNPIAFEKSSGNEGVKEKQYSEELPNLENLVLKKDAVKETKPVVKSVSSKPNQLTKDSRKKVEENAKKQSRANKADSNSNINDAGDDLINSESFLGKFLKFAHKNVDARDSDHDDEPTKEYSKLSVFLKRIEILERALLKENRGGRFKYHIGKLTALTKKIKSRINVLKQDIIFDQYEGDAKAEKQWKLRQGTYEYNVFNIVEEEKKLFELREEISEKEKEKEQEETVLEIGSKGEEKSVELLDSTSASGNGDNENSDDDGGGGLFGNLMDSDSELGGNNVQASTSTTDNSNKGNIEILDLSVPPNWHGMMPKELLGELSRKLDSRVRITFIKEKLSKGTGFRSTLKLSWSKPNAITSIKKLLTENSLAEIDKLVTTWKLPEQVACSAQKDAEHFVATLAIYEVFNQSASVFKRLPVPYQEIWDEWAKRDSEEEAELLFASERIEFLRSLVRDPPSPPQSPILTYKFDSNDDMDNDTEQGSGFDIQKAVKINKSRRAKKWSWKKFVDRRLKNERSMQDINRTKASLPIASYRSAITAALEHNQVIIVQGDTGCGKSTQVPQFIVEHLLERGNYNGCEVLCTQPRRISVTSISSRISQELCDPKPGVGGIESLVGYQIRMESQKAWSNMLLFCTTGILLRRLESDPLLEGVSHIIVDEVQERTIESDFLLTVIRDLLPKRPDLRLIVMSATIDISLFSNYFRNCPIVTVPGRTFPVASFNLERVIENTGYSLDKESKYVSKKASKKSTIQGSVTVSGRGGNQHKFSYVYDKEAATSNVELDDEDGPYADYSSRTRATLARMDNSVVNIDLIHHLIRHIVLPKSRDEYINSLSSVAEAVDEQSREWEARRRVDYEEMQQCIPSEGAILVFLPGMLEIRNLFNLLSNDADLMASLDKGDPKSPQRTLVIPLHSSLMTSQAKDGNNESDVSTQAFATPPAGVRKIVLSTNVAETGITIPDITVVIDSGKSNQVNWDPHVNQMKLQTRWISKANCKQRKGRAGRVREGVCLCLYTSEQYSKMASFEKPELLRMPLHELCLKLKVYGYPSIIDFLMKVPQPPQLDSVVHSIQSLIDVGALRKDETLTILGQYMSRIPVGILISKVLIFGAILKCLDPILTIAACCSLNKSIMLTPFEEPDRSNAKAAHSPYYNQSLESFMAKSEVNRHSVHYKPAVGGSDFIAMYLAYSDWKEQASKPKAKRSELVEFCKKRYLDIGLLEMVEDLKEEYIRLLADIGFVSFEELMMTKSGGAEARDMKKGKKRHTTHEINKLLRPFQKGNHGFRSGFVQVPNSVNRYSGNSAVIHAAIVAGLGNILVPNNETPGTLMSYQIKHSIDAPQPNKNGNSTETSPYNDGTTSAAMISKSSVKKHTVYIHPTSVNANSLKNSSVAPSSATDNNDADDGIRGKVIVAHDIVARNGRSLASRTAWVSPLLSLLFAEKIDIRPSAKIVTLDGCLQTKCYPRTASVCQYMRNRLNSILKFMLYNPGSPIPAELNEWLDIIIKAISEAH